MTQSLTGQPCQRCTGHLVCYCSRRITGGKRVRYFGCWLCNWRPAANKLIDDAPPAARPRTRSGTDRP